jgi:hypothetical protein
MRGLNATCLVSLNRKYENKILDCRRMDLAQLVRFLVVELTHSCSNPIFDMCVVFTTNYSFSGRRRPRRERDVIGDRLRESPDQADSVFQMCS